MLTTGSVRSATRVLFKEMRVQQKALLKLRRATIFDGWHWADWGPDSVVSHYLFGQNGKDFEHEKIKVSLKERGFACHPVAHWTANAELCKEGLALLPNGNWLEITQYPHPFNLFDPTERIYWCRSRSFDPTELTRLLVSDHGKLEVPLARLEHPTFVLSVQGSGATKFELALLETFVVKENALPPAEHTDTMLQDPVFLITALCGSVPYESG